MNDIEIDLKRRLDAGEITFKYYAASLLWGEENIQLCPLCERKFDNIHFDASLLKECLSCNLTYHTKLKSYGYQGTIYSEQEWARVLKLKAFL